MMTKRFAIVLSAVLLLPGSAFAADATARLGPDTYLLEAKAPAGSIIAFVPSGAVNGNYLIAKREDSAAYRKWAEESHPGRSVSLQWDVVPFEMDVVADRILLACVRKGDEGVDPSGRFRFTVAADPDPSSGRVSLLLANPPAAKDFDPYCCASNVWILSRDALFDRWGDEVQAGRVRETRAAFRSLERAGRFATSPEWRSAANAFAAKPGLCAAIRFRNGKQAQVRVRIEGETRNVRPGDSWDWKPDAPLRTGEVEWMARDLGDGRFGDDDWEWRSDRVAFDPMGDDVSVDLSGPCGRLKPSPFLAFPDGALPPGVDLRAELRYADEARGVPAAIVERDGRRGVECEPGREVRQCVVRADGWKDARFGPPGPSAVFVRDQSVSLVGAGMERALAPWKDGAVRIAWNGFGGKVRILAQSEGQTVVDQTIAPGTEIVPIPLGERLRDLPASETQVSVSWWSEEKNLGAQSCSVRRGVHPGEIAVGLPAPAPKVPWPDRNRVKEAHDWFSGNGWNGYSIQFYLKPSERESDYHFKRNRQDAKRALFRLLGFRPEAWSDFHPEWRGFEVTFDEMVAHIESCPGCLAHRSSLPACAEALRSLGADIRLIQSLTAWPNPKNFPSFMTSWWGDCAVALMERHDLQYDSTAKLNHAKERWNGGGKVQKSWFAEAFVHILCCPGCLNCPPFRDDMLREKTFEARRAALFRALMKHGWNWGQTPRPEDGEIDRILQKFTPTPEGAK